MKRTAASNPTSPIPKPPSARHGSGLVRTVVVAVSTLAILLVCFSMYQYSQMSPETAQRPPRLPPTPTEPPRLTTSDAAGHPGVPFGQGVIGAGQNITVTIYPKEGTQSQMELSVRDWVPRAGSDHEFLLTSPEVRLRTKAGNNVRVTAREGVLDAQRKSGGGLDPRRGELDGDVVIEFDRRTDKDKAALSSEQRERIDPADLVRIAADRIEFDLEYSKLVVPGRLQLQARDVELTAEELELRFDETQGQVESLRIARGGRIELADLAGRLAVKVPGANPDQPRRTTLVDWLRDSLEQKFAAAQPAPAIAPPAPSLRNDENLPVFRGAEKTERAKPRALYFARFEGDVDGRHFLGDAMQSRLRSDSLEVLREFTELDQKDAPPPADRPASPAGDSSKPADAAPERIVLEWTGRLQVNSLSADDPRFAGSTRSRISAIGQPAHLAHPEGEIRCRRLDYEPDNGVFRLEGAADQPLAVRSADQGAMTGQTASFRRSGDVLNIAVTGPGTLSDGDEAGGRVIEFADRLDADGRFLTRTTIDFMGGISTRRQRVLDRAVFTGRVRVREGDTTLEADTLQTTFAESSRRGDRPALSRVSGRGDVVMTQKNDRIDCDAIEVSFALDAAGASRPRTAVASGGVTAIQGERTLRAADSLTVDFDPVSAEGAPSASAIQVAARRIRAQGGVTIQDETQGLDVTADRLECTVSNAREIEKAVLFGDADRPASARMDALTVTGHRINLDVPNQWAEVPGDGRLAFLSKKNLDGQRLAKPLPIVITWSEQMKFHGRENRALFDGNVHAVGESTTTFDCKQLLIEFVDAAPPDRAADWNLLRPIVETVTQREDDAKNPLGKTRFSKEPVYLLADGDAVAETADLEPDSGVMLSRSRIAGPRLSVNLRNESSRMLIEGPGTLQLEDFRPPNPKTQAVEQKRSDLFQVGQDSGASKTLVEWRERMWYDFAIAQTRFEGKVSLKHLSGAELEKLFELTSTAPLPAGRATFLNCDELTIDFVDRDARASDPTGRRAARLSGDRLRQFQASGAVTLHDQVEHLTVAADSVVYERPRQLLAVSGTKQRKAQITLRKPGQMPQQVATERLFYNLATGKIELVQTTIKGQ